MPRPTALLTNAGGGAHNASPSGFACLSNFFSIGVPRAGCQSPRIHPALTHFHGLAAAHTSHEPARLAPDCTPGVNRAGLDGAGRPDRLSGPTHLRPRFTRRRHAEPRLALAGCRPSGPLEPHAGSALRDYAAGRPDDFADVPVDTGGSTPAQCYVLDLCRMIPYGQTLTYGELARQAGLPRAARFVGNCMARNRVPLIIPCHRVVPAGGKLGRYSAASGPEMKRRLLALEAGACPIISR